MLEKINKAKSKADIYPRNDYHPLPWQEKPYEDQSKILLLTGSAGGGKSRVAAEKIHRNMLRYPGATGLVVRKAREFVTKSAVQLLHRKVMVDDHRVKINKSSSYFEYTNGSLLFWGGLKDDNQREAIRSMGQDGAFDFIWVEEANALSERDYLELLSRLRGTAADWRQLMLTTNPDSPMHWIKRRLIDDGEATVYRSSAKDNPNNPDDYIDTLEMLTGVQYQRLVLGKWVAAEGQVYDDFNEEIHIIEPFDIPADWKRYRSIDFGYRNPFVCQWWALDHDDRLYMYREIYMTGRTVKEHAEQINRLSEGERYVATIADHDASDRATLRENGISTIAARKDVRVGIEKVQQRLKVQPDGLPRLFYVQGALVEKDTTLEAANKPTCTVQEYPGYVFPDTKQHKNEDENPVKVDDHGLDDTRYMVMEIDKGGITVMDTNPFFN